MIKDSEVKGMLDKDRIRLMTKMAKYEDTKAEEDLKIVSYRKKDYASFNTWITAIWITIGYALVVGIVLFSMSNTIFDSLNIRKLTAIAMAIVVIYIFILVSYCVYTKGFYENKYDKAHRRVKKYYKELSHLGKSYMKEKR